MKITTIFVSSSIATVALALALPAPQLGESWGGFFGPDPGYYPYGAVNPHYPPQLHAPSGVKNPVPAPPPLLAPIPYAGEHYQDASAPLPPRPPQPPSFYYPSPPPPPPPPGPGPFDAPQAQRPSAPLQAPQAPQAPRPPQPPAPLPIPGLELPAPKAPAASPRLHKPVSEKPRDKKPLAQKFAPELEDAPASRPVVEDESSSDKDAIRYHVNVGGIQKGAGGGTTNFHVYSDENGKKRFSDELDEDTEKYITEGMIPKLGGKKRGDKGSGVWSVFGDK